MNLNGIVFNPSYDGRLAYKIAKSPRLLAFADEAELTRLADAYRASMKARIAAGSLPVPTTEVTSEVRSALLDGKPVDPAVVMEKLSASAAAEAHRQRTVDVFRGIETALHRDIVGVLQVAEEDAWFGLGEQLEDILDRAEPVFAELDGALTADAAIDADRLDAYRTARKLTEEYADLRAAHRDLLAANDFEGGDEVLLFAYFGEGIADLAPSAFRVNQPNPRDVLQHTAPGRSLPHDVTALEHLAWVMANRERLTPRVATVDEAKATAGSAVSVPRESSQPEGGELRGYYGSEAAVMRRSGF